MSAVDSTEPPSKGPGPGTLIMLAAISAIGALTLFGEPDVQLVVGVIGFIFLSGIGGES